jgi:hypothetical protein
MSFDIDGTLEVGEPPGPLRLAFVRWAKEHGCVIGSSSDRTLSFQAGLWTRAGITTDFVSGKHELTDLRTRFDCDRFIHIGDTQVDEHFARIAGFTYFPVEDVAEKLRDCGEAGLT